ncbi:MAG: AAA family ATPase [Bacteroidetes bacterium GWA2_31_9]|nr:MAG: AAA family ATPase [Bacteroidetes bacterium GWA2_31_9]
MERLIELSQKKIQNVPTEFKRYLFKKINLDNRLIGISGARGSGKTTLLLQLLVEHYSENKQAMYISLDDLYFTKNELVYFAENFVKKGGKCLFIDEVHKYPNWSQELKNIYDNLPELKVIFTSSSALQIYKGSHDLSRRALIYNLAGLSFREFLTIKYKIDFEEISLNDILEFPEKISNTITNKIKPFQYFTEYLKNGFYPFCNDNESDYQSRLLATINLVIENDLLAIESIDYKSIVKLKKLILILPQMVPYKPNITQLAEQIETTRSTLMKYLDILFRAQILFLLNKDTMGINLLNKPEKIYLHNPNLYYALCTEQPNIGSIRETFFVNQISHNHKICYSDSADFFVNNKYTFEIGGKNKTRKQIKDSENAFIVKDDIEYGYENVIPLYLFGFLY